VNAVRLVYRKWRDRPHWEGDGLLLGSDSWGRWLGIRQGTLMTRPGASYTTDQDIVVLVPRDQPFVASFYAPGGTAHCSVYVDITTVPVWGADSVTAVDLDLDVVRGWTGRVWVDDEDEFADHRVRYAYPQPVVQLAVTSCEEVLDAVRSGRPPYDGGVSGPWFGRLGETMMGR